MTENQADKYLLRKTAKMKSYKFMLILKMLRNVKI